MTVVKLMLKRSHEGGNRHVVSPPGIRLSGAIGWSEILNVTTGRSSGEPTHHAGLIGRSGIGNGRVNSVNQRKGCKLTPPASDSVASGGRS